MEGRRFHSSQIFFLFSVCVVLAFGQNTDMTCESFRPETEYYEVPKDHFMTFRFTMSGSETCSDKFNSSYIVKTTTKEAPIQNQRLLCQILKTSDSFEKSDNCFYNPSSKTFTGTVAFHDTGEMILTISGIFKNDSTLIAQIKASIAITVIEATETDDENNNRKIQINNAILFSFIGCVVFLMIIIAILCGIVIRRTVSTPTHPPPAPVPDENVIELQQLPTTQGAENRVSTLSNVTNVYQDIRDDLLPESSTDADGYMQPRPWVLPSRSTRPTQGPLLLSDRGNISSPSSSASYVNTTSGATSTRPPVPLQTSAMTVASVGQPQPNESDVLESSTGGYMPMGVTTGGYTQMTRPTTPASATHITPQTTEGTSAVETPHVYANGGKEVTKCAQPSAKAKDQPYENLK